MRVNSVFSLKLIHLFIKAMFLSELSMVQKVLHADILINF